MSIEKSIAQVSRRGSSTADRSRASADRRRSSSARQRHSAMRNRRRRRQWNARNEATGIIRYLLYFSSLSQNCSNRLDFKGSVQRVCIMRFYWIAYQAKRDNHHHRRFARCENKSVNFLSLTSARTSRRRAARKKTSKSWKRIKINTNSPT